MKIYTTRRMRKKTYTRVLSKVATILLLATLAFLGTHNLRDPQQVIEPAIAAVVTPVDYVVDQCTLSTVDCESEKPTDEELAENIVAETPMAGLGHSIVQTAKQYDVDWRIVLGIADIESNFGSSYWYAYDQNCHNAWGIKPPGGRRADGSYLRCYSSWQDGINSISALLARRYPGQTPEQMNCTYVVPCNSTWVQRVSKYLENTPKPQ